MEEAPAILWDGIRPRLDRHVVAHRQARLGPLDVIAATENLALATDWYFAEDQHKIVVHLGGRLDRMEYEFSQGPSGSRIPDSGDIWIVPAGCRYAALAQGEQAQFIELTVPTALLGHAEPGAHVGYRDDFLSSACRRLYHLMDRPQDDVAAMAAHAIAHALGAHMRDIFAQRPADARAGDLSPAACARLVDAIRGQLDSAHSLQALAALVGMGVRQFTSAFRRAFGVTPWQYVLMARLESAADRLRRSDATVTEIALAVGFATPSHFATAFTRHYGVSPSRYRLAAS